MSGFLPVRPFPVRVRTALVSAFATTAALLVLPALPVSAATGWDAGRELGDVASSDGTPPGAERYSRIDANVAAAGQRVAIAWLDTRRDNPTVAGGRNTEMEMRVSTDGGATFGPLTNISRDRGLNVGRPALAVGSSSALIAFGTADDDCYECPRPIMVARVEDDGTETRTTLPITTSGAVYASTQLAADPAAGTAAVVGGGDQVQVAFSDDDGRTWNAPVPVPGAGTADAAVWPDVAVQGRTVTVTWIQTPPGGSAPDVYASSSADGGATWTAPVAVTRTAEKELQVSLARSGNRLVAAWHTPRTATSTTTDTAVSVDGGRTWSAPRRIADHPLDTRHYGYFRPTVVGDQAGVLVSTRFPEHDPYTPTEHTSRLFSTADGQTFSAQGFPAFGVADMARTGSGDVLGMEGISTRLHRLYTDTTAPTVAITSGPTGHTTVRDHTVAVAAADDRDPAELRYTCTTSTNFQTVDQGGNLYCGPSFRLSSAQGHNSLTVTVTDRLGNSSSATRSWIYDTVAPVASVPVLDQPRLALAPSVGVRLSARDQVGVVSYQVRIRKGSLGQPLAAPVVPADMNAVRTNNAPVTVRAAVPAGSEWCFSVRATDATGNVGAWSADRCVARAADDRALAALTPGWARQSLTGAYGSTVTSTQRTGAALIARSTFSARLALVATKCPTCGTVDVLIGSYRIARVSLTAPTTQRKAVIVLPAYSPRRTDVTVKVVSSRRLVQIDGLIAGKSS